MEHIPVLRDLVVLVAVAIPAVLLAHRLNIPTLVGFLFTGIVIGPHALGFVRDTESVTQMAEIGSVLLLTRSRYAVHAFGASLVGMIVGLAYQRFGMVIPESLTTGVMAVMPWVIFAIGIALFVYARTQAAKGVLR